MEFTVDQVNDYGREFVRCDRLPACERKGIRLSAVIEERVNHGKSCTVFRQRNLLVSGRPSGLEVICAHDGTFRVFDKTTCYGSLSKLGDAFRRACEVQQALEHGYLVLGEDG